MEKEMTTDVNELRSKLSTKEVLTVDTIPITFFSKKNNRSTKLIDNVSQENVLRGKNSRFEFSFNKPLYIASITVKTKGYSNYTNFEFYWSSPNNTTEKSLSKKFSEGEALISLNEIINSFAIKPPKQYLSSPEIESVTVWGFTLEEFNESCLQAGELQEYKESILTLCDESIKKASEAEGELSVLNITKSEIENKISALQTKKTDLQQEIESTKDKLEEASIALSEKRSQESDVTGRIESLDDSIDQKKNESLSLNSQISTNQEQLKRLRSDINMFPSEFQGFVTQGGRNIRWYSALALIPMLLLVGYTVVLFNGAIDLTTIYQRKESIDLLSTFLSRIPFVTISIFIIHFCYAISKVFIRELIRINQQRLNLSKISIVAKDVADTAMSNLDLSDNEIYEIRTKLKMDLIKSHLKGYVDDSYEYDLEVGLWQKFINLKGMNKPEQKTPIEDN